LDFIEKTHAIPLLVRNGKKWTKNITDWALRHFREYYKDDRIDGEAIFHYVYAIFHSREYQKDYVVNLKRELPRIPLVDDFWQWAKWGEELMNLHLDYANAKPYMLTRKEKDIEKNRQNVTRLKADKKLGRIVLDDKTVLQDIPKEAWEYKLGNRSALEWILDQYKEKTPKDPTIKKDFNSYQFEDYKDHVIDLIQRLVTVSVESLRIIGEMENC
jgi:predicted helicase